MLLPSIWRNVLENAYLVFVMVPMSFIKTYCVLMIFSSQWRQSSDTDCFIDNNISIYRLYSKLFKCIISSWYELSIPENCNKICNSTHVTLLVSLHSPIHHQIFCTISHCYIFTMLSHTSKFVKSYAIKSQSIVWTRVSITLTFHTCAHRVG